MLKALAITSSKNIHRNGEFIAAHLGLARHLVRIHVDQLHNPVGIGARSGREEIGDRRAAYPHWRGEHGGLIGQYIGAVGDRALIGNKPCLPTVRIGKVHGTRQVGNWLSGIGDVGVRSFSRRAF